VRGAQCLQCETLPLVAAALGRASSAKGACQWPFLPEAPGSSENRLKDTMDGIGRSDSKRRMAIAAVEPSCQQLHHPESLSPWQSKSPQYAPRRQETVCGHRVGKIRRHAHAEACANRPHRRATGYSSAPSQPNLNPDLQAISSAARNPKA